MGFPCPTSSIAWTNAESLSAAHLETNGSKHEEFVKYMHSKLSSDIVNKIRGILFNTLWLSNAICRHRSGSTLVKVMAWCLATPSHYLNQCWFIIKCVPWHSTENIFTISVHGRNPQHVFQDSILKLLPHLPGDNGLISNVPILGCNCCMFPHFHFRNTLGDNEIHVSW